MSILYYLENFNSYYNRTIKRATDRDLSSFMDFVLKVDSDFNFNPNDHVSTKIVVNYTYYENGIEYDIDDERNIDYILVSEDNQTVKSKWFVTDRVRNLGGQWSLTLRRDLISDYYNIIRESPIFVEKGWLNTSNPLIYNSENISFNQIKKKEVLLKDATETPWIIGYLANNYSSAEGADADNITASFVAENTVYPELSWLDYRIIHTIYTGGENQTLITRLRNIPDGRIFDIKQSGSFTQKTDNPNATGLPYIPSASTNFFSNITGSDTTPINTFIYDYYNAPRFTADLSIAGFTNTAPYMENIDELLKVNGMKVRNTDYTEGQEETNGPEYFYVSLVPQGTETRTVYLPVAGEEYNRAKELVQSIYQNGGYANKFEFRTYSANGNTFAVEFTTMKYAFGTSKTGVPTTVRTSFLNLQDKEKKQLVDAPYVMFATPYFDIPYTNASGQQKQHNGEAGRNLSAEVIKRFSGGYAYDLQLLPYCPIPSLVKDGIFDMTGLQGDTFANIWAGENEVGFFVFCENSSFSNVIELDEPILLPQDTVEAKVDTETKMCRLVSPNYSGAFEFTPTKNGGVSAFEVNATYKPYQPYIHVTPIFNAGYLYGGNFDDNRGLICGGEFSLPQASDAWISYQSQNKSYREAFNRQVENMEVNNAVQREREIWGAVAGSVGGAAGGAVTGGYIGGGPIGAAIGGAVGGVAAIAGGIRDIQLADKLRAEALDYTKDQFGYSLQNIKALPNTMSRTSAFDVNNKLFPFLEYYGCFEEEEKALKNKLKYNGMTIMVIGYIDEYIRQNDISYFKGQLIRFEGSAENHEIVEIANELNKGVFI